MRPRQMAKSTKGRMPPTVMQVSSQLMKPRITREIAMKITALMNIDMFVLRPSYTT